MGLFLAMLSLLVACAGPKPLKPPPGVRPPPTGERPDTGLSETKRLILGLAQREWEFFGRQVVVLEEQNESIPHVGHWEDDGEPYNSRVNAYWRAVGRPHLDGDDCREPWSAAFISWVMQESGLPSYQFPPAEAHRDYLLPILDASGNPDPAFKAHTVIGYSPQPGDLVCAVRGTGGALPYPGEDPALILATHSKLHCDIVVANDGRTVEVIGGNVRNSVSKTVLPLNRKGELEPTERRPWFLTLENRL